MCRVGFPVSPKPPGPRLPRTPRFRAARTPSKAPRRSACGVPYLLFLGRSYPTPSGLSGHHPDWPPVLPTPRRPILSPASTLSWPRRTLQGKGRLRQGQPCAIAGDLLRLSTINCLPDGPPWQSFADSLPDVPPAIRPGWVLGFPSAAQTVYTKRESTTILMWGFTILGVPYCGPKL